MNIFYGVQGTGNGHITRARAMARELSEVGIEVDFMFTGRKPEDYFDMEIFGKYQTRSGLTFDIKDGQVNLLKTIVKTKPNTLIRDIKSLDLSGYDLVITDFEPVTAWAAKIKNIPVLGIGHQYAFSHKIPRYERDPVADLVMKHFAPATKSIGLHWHHFGQPILPPIIDTHRTPKNPIHNKIMVYLPFENINSICDHLEPFDKFEFHVYHPVPFETKHDHIKSKPLSRDGFQKDLYNSSGVICNAGFELASEALQLGVKILVKPVHLQMEQLANAVALKRLGYGHVMHDLDYNSISAWLHDHNTTRVTYPNVASWIVNWIKDGMPKLEPEFIEDLWADVDVIHSKIQVD